MQVECKASGHKPSSMLWHPQPIPQIGISTALLNQLVPGHCLVEIIDPCREVWIEVCFHISKKHKLKVPSQISPIYVRINIILRWEIAGIAANVDGVTRLINANVVDG
jgi:hypothetical protein